MTVLRGRVVTLTEAGEFADGVVSFAGPRLDYVGPATEFAGELPEPAERIVLPGLVDVHCHGGGGFGFPEADLDGVAVAANFHRAHGTTTLVGSLVSATEAELRERIDVLGAAVATGLLAGIHLEGPFISPHRRGAHDPHRIRPGDPAVLARLLDYAGGRIASVTVAPETAGFDALAQVLAAANVVLSLGHTEAGYERSVAALRQGGRVSVTHLFNAMPGLAHRDPGFLTAALAAAGRGEVVAEVIADGVHLADGTVRMLFDTVGPSNLALVTDAMAAAGRPDGRYRLGGLDVVVRDGVSRLYDPDGRGPIAGGTAAASDVLRRTVFHAGVGLTAAATAAAATPARLLGLAGEVGALRPGMRADLLVTDHDLNPVDVYKDGAQWNS
ncbi:N-acetylglucosamine-6-phosphate deacetylase [Nocardia stercoris]|uniref:N-acetylglucosamine-6-phosphate deacetylase n=1 Tax=Nocardia stercoris TaxID=2483361 RepID=A0A3M2KZN3_9NOCA|nr:N-acetylglucosamine-6-phosphate deacetylase [Nocardia stercoris]RMI27768.1 N-acetylglucosamine-6-phosphate deacetylase [Nocardia stercoris]